MTGPSSRQPSVTDRPSAAAWRNLAVATLGFTLTFWAWNLVAPLAGSFDDKLHMSPSAQSLLVAVPVLVGSLGRVPVGALTDRYGARLMFPLVSALTIVPVLLLIPAKGSYGALITVGPPGRGAGRLRHGHGRCGPCPGTSRRGCTSTARTSPSWCSRRPSPSTPCSPPY